MFSMASTISSKTPEVTDYLARQVLYQGTASAVRHNRSLLVVIPKEREEGRLATDRARLRICLSPIERKSRCLAD